MRRSVQVQKFNFGGMPFVATPAIKQLVIGMEMDMKGVRETHDFWTMF